MTNLCAAAALLTLLVPRPFGAQPLLDPIDEWSVAASAAVAAAGMPPLRRPITLAILHLAMYDAVSAVTGDREPYAGPAPVVTHASAPAAAIEAGYHILLVEIPSRQADLNLVYQRLRSQIADSPEKVNGTAAGAEAAQRLLTLRRNDGRNLTVPYVPGSGPATWIPTPPEFLPSTSAFLARVTPFTMDSPSQFRPAGPPRLDSKAWVRDYDEVKTLGVNDGSTRTVEQTATALFWEPLAGTVWTPTIRRVAREQSLDLGASARLHAAAFAAFADSVIACWDAKFHFNFWRPVTAIRAGETDGNNRTAPDPAWQPLAPTPNFSEYPSGHTCVSAAVAHTIEDFFRHDIVIPARNVTTGEERFYAKASELVDEVVEARMLLGLHFRAGDEDGADIGRRIARQIRSRWFRKRSASGHRRSGTPRERTYP
jgi:hypothetical protein